MMIFLTHSRSIQYQLHHLDKFTKDTAYTMTMNFEDGMVSTDFTAYGNEELLEEMNLSKGGLDKGLIKLIPENAIMVAAQAVNMEVARDMFNKHLMPLIENELGGELDQIMEQMEEMIGLSMDELMSIPKGDFLAVWENLEMV